MKYSRTPVVEIRNKLLDYSGVRLLVKLEYLNHPYISGNKFWKLKYNLVEAISQGKKKLLTFGGAYSNHIYATASCAREAGMECVGIIRGEKILPLNSTLLFAESNGMELNFISREDYRKKSDQKFQKQLSERFGDFYLIPEGGTNLLAVKGCAEFGKTQFDDIDFDHLLLPVGTGGTMAGLICAFEGKKNITGVSVLKGGEFLQAEIEKLVFDFSGKQYSSWKLINNYHQGGYAKSNKDLEQFISDMRENHNLPWDHVYTGKLMWAIMKEIELGNFPRGSTALALHTGGLQGNNL